MILSDWTKEWPNYYRWNYHTRQKEGGGLDRGWDGMQWTDGWKGWRTPENFQWHNLSPQDWIVILESLSLVWNDRHFVENFGAEKAKLEAALSKLYSTFHSISGIDLQCGQNTNIMNRICLYAYKREVKRRGKDGDVHPQCIHNASTMHS